MVTVTVSRQKWALAAGLALMLAWGVNFSVTKVVLAELGVAPFLFIRFLAMPLFGFALLVAVTRRHFPRSWPRREDLARFVAAGLIGHTAHVSLVMWGINLSTAFSSSLVLTSSPLFTLLILALLGAEKLRRRQLVGTLVAFAGIASIEAGEVFYSSNYGIAELREALAAYTTRLHRPTSSARIVVTSAGVNALMLVSSW